MISWQKTYKNLLSPPIPVKQPAFLSKKAIKVYNHFKPSISTHSQFCQLIQRCKSCSARESQYLPVPPQGPTNTLFLFQGRNPGLQEAVNQMPFYPQALGGRLLTTYLQYLNLSRSEVYITNSLFCYTLKDRPPLFEESLTCSLWKLLELSFLPNIAIVFLLGNDAFQQWISSDLTILKLYGSIFYTYHPHTNKPILLIPIVHPGYILRNRWAFPIIANQLSLLRNLVQKVKQEGHLPESWVGNPSYITSTLIQKS